MKTQAISTSQQTIETLKLFMDSHLTGFSGLFPWYLTCCYN